MFKRKNDSASASGSSKRFKKYYKKNKTYKRFNKPITPGCSTITHKFKRWSASQSDSVIVTTSDVSSAATYKRLELQFRLIDVAGQSEFLALYDQYRIKYIKVKIIPRTEVNTNLQTSITGIFLPPIRILHAIDYDSATGSVTPDQLRQYGTCKEILYRDINNKDLTVFFTPACLQQIYESFGNTGYSPKFWQWLDVNDNQTLHYGLKILLDNKAAFTDVQIGMGFDYDVQYYLEFRNSR